jgi:hypothetical protein
MPESSQQLFRFKPGCPLVVFHTPGDLSRRFFLFLEPPLLVLLQFWINIGVFNAILWGWTSELVLHVKRRRYPVI